MPIWHRHSDPLIELSLASEEAPADSQRWEIRLEGNTLELKLMDDSGLWVEKLSIEREGARFKKILHDEREFPL